jgi:hypothetical protein
VIEWSLLNSHQDAEELAEFTCTEPAPDSFGPDDDVDDLEFAYEFEAQVGLQQITYPLPRGEFVLLGRDSAGLAAACWWTEQAGARYVHIESLGVALRLRRTGQYVGDQLLDEVIQELATNADQAGHDQVMIRARIDWANSASQDLFSRKRFTYKESDGYYQQWWLRIDLA